MKKFLIVFTSLFTISSCVSITQIPSASMEPTIKKGETIYTQRTCNYFPKRGDIILFKDLNNPNKQYLKRCIAIAGDDFKIKEGSVFINGKKIDEKI